MDIEIITPEKSQLTQSIDMVIMPAYNGKMGVLPGHMPMVVLLREGNLTIKKDNKTEDFHIDRGFARITPERVVILPEHIRKHRTK